MREGEVFWVGVGVVAAAGVAWAFVRHVVRGYRAAVLEPSACGRCGARKPGRFCSRCGVRKF